MFTRKFSHLGSFNWYKVYSFIFVLTLLVLLTANATIHLPTVSLHAQSQLLELANQQPETEVNVIVQKAGSGAGVENKVMALGGVVTNDLHIINGFGAKMPAKAVPELAGTPEVRWVSLDAPVVRSGFSSGYIETENLKNTYITDVKADKVWNQAHFQGDNINIAVVDSGINPGGDFYTQMGQARIVAAVQFNGGYNQSVFDGYGHGTHVAGIIGGGGRNSGGAYIGVAPNSNLINVKVTDDNGSATIANVVSGLQWINDNRATNKIRVVNLSLNATTADSYNTDPLDAAVEVLWFNKIVVVASAGNKGNGAIYAPANDPFVITVGAVDDKGTADVSDDTLASFSAFGLTSDGINKPDLVAPGTNIVSVLSSSNANLALAHPQNMVGNQYFRMSGTSVSAPIVAGAAALLLQANPNLTPDQIKFRLKATARPFDIPLRAGAGYLDIYAAVNSNTLLSANTGLSVSKLLSGGLSLNIWDSVSWNSVSWNSVSWNSVSWNSVSWDSVSWNSDYWGT